MLKTERRYYDTFQKQYETMQYLLAEYVVNSGVHVSKNTFYHLLVCLLSVSALLSFYVHCFLCQYNVVAF